MFLASVTVRCAKGVAEDERVAGAGHGDGATVSFAFIKTHI